MRVGDRIGLTVTHGGTDITAAVESVRARFGYDLRVAECDVTCALTPAFADWGNLVIQAGLTSLASDTSGPGTQRFAGVTVDRGVNFWPYTPHLSGVGWLGLVDRFVVPDDLWADFLSPASNPDPLGQPSKYAPPGVDMTAGGVGLTDVDQIVYVLSHAGVLGHAADIGGLGYLLGTQINRAFDQFVWKRGQSGLSYIQELDAIYGFRTWDGPDGQIHRNLTSSFAPFEYTAYTLNENQDILEGATIVRDVDNIRNRIVVQGFDPGGGPLVWAVHGGVSVLPPGIATRSETFSSGMIEKQNAGDPGDGMSCEEAANYWLGELQYPMLEAVVPTWRDEPFTIGQVIYLNAPHLLGVNQSMWLKHLEIEVTPNSFTQILTLRAQDFDTFRGPPVLPLALG